MPPVRNSSHGEFNVSLWLIYKLKLVPIALFTFLCLICAISMMIERCCEECHFIKVFPDLLNVPLISMCKA